MLRNKFCANCGTQFPYDDSNFCNQCGTKRGSYIRREEHPAGKAPAVAPAQVPAPISLSSDSSTSTPSAEASLSSSANLTHLHEPPSYETIFKPPPNSLKKPGKAYGKLALKNNCPPQHKRLLDNYKKVKQWICAAQEKGVLPHGAFNLEDEAVRKSLHRVIEENLGNLKSIKVKRGVEYNWKEDDIYRKTKGYLKYLRKKERKRQCAETSSKGPRAVADTLPRV